MKAIAISALTMGLAFACGGGSGGGDAVSSGTPIVELSGDQTVDVCETWAGLLGPEREIDCGDGQTVTIGGAMASECVDELTQIQTSAPGCPITFGEYDACIRALAGQSDAEWCGGGFPAACEVLMDPACVPADDGPGDPPSP